MMATGIGTKTTSPKKLLEESKRKYEKVYINSVSDKSCTLADRRMTFEVNSQISCVHSLVKAK